MISRELQDENRSGLGRQLTPAHVRVFVAGEEVANAVVNLAAFVCTVILDNLDDNTGNEIALVWASVAAGYTIGVTVYSLRYVSDAKSSIHR